MINYNHLIKQRDNQIYGFFFYIPLFFIVSFVGWVWEVLIYIVRDGEFINRGVLLGPWLPLYGSGGIMLAILFRKYEQKPVRVFFLSMLVCSVLEYLSSFFLERVWGIRWWDYSNDFLNISGRICLWGSLLFGLSGWLMICYVIPYFKMLFRKLWRREGGRKVIELVCLVLILLFVADAAWAADFPNMGRSITY